MKKIFIVLCVLILSSGTAFSGGYISGNLGVAIPESSDITFAGEKVTNAELNTDFAASLAMGYEFDNMRLETEVSYQQNEVEEIAQINVESFDIDTISISLLANTYWDFKNSTDFTPYISGGIGFANVWLEAPDTSSESDFVFAYQVGGGLDYAINDNMNIGIKYRYFGTSDVEYEPLNIEYSNSSHNIYVGARFNF
ncbi:MAG: porin family protein [Methylococcales symbiont of Hymedesmia sp. n. MRB-2018]|nr:MAG: porin family protein [Methylococcales symbiont of Hymedesmia sp. n. MRB-2018]